MDGVGHARSHLAAAPEETAAAHTLSVVAELADAVIVLVSIDTDTHKYALRSNIFRFLLADSNNTTHTKNAPNEPNAHSNRLTRRREEVHHPVSACVQYRVRSCVCVCVWYWWKPSLSSCTVAVGKFGSVAWGAVLQSVCLSPCVGSRQWPIFFFFLGPCYTRACRRAHAMSPLLTQRSICTGLRFTSHCACALIALIVRNSCRKSWFCPFVSQSDRYHTNTRTHAQNVLLLPFSFPMHTHART